MAILQKLLAALLTAASIAILPAGAFAGATTMPGCASAVDSGSHDECCGGDTGMSMSACSLLCAISSTAAVGAANPRLSALSGEAPVACSKRAIPLLSGPPDTAPPKP